MNQDPMAINQEYNQNENEYENEGDYEGFNQEDHFNSQRELEGDQQSDIDRQQEEERLIIAGASDVLSLLRRIGKGYHLMCKYVSYSL